MESPVKQSDKQSDKRWTARSVYKTVFNHIRKHTGVGIICAVAYFDPGNWGVDLEAGSEYGYKLLFIVLVAGLFAVFLQILATRLGCVTGLDLASHCRLWLHSRPKHRLLYRWLALYPLYALAECAIIATDLAELLGSAIALVLIFPALPLWAGVLITASDVILILALGNPLAHRPVKMFEYLIAFLVLAVFICMAIVVAKLSIEWGQVFEGYLPSKAAFSSGGLFITIGIMGATIMPHSIFLGSALATQDRLSEAPPKPYESTVSLETTSMKIRSQYAWMKQSLAEMLRTPPRDFTAGEAKNHAEHQNNELAFIRAHLYHGIVDVAVHLLGFAVLINSFILIIASAVFYYGSGGDSGSSGAPASLFDAHDLIERIVGSPAALLFAIALLAAGQSASIVATLAGQTVSEGFLRWRLSPVMRRLITRLIGLIPSMTVAIAVGRPGINSLLVISQVILSITLPFITFPLIILTSSKSVMRVAKPASETVTPQADIAHSIENGTADVEYVDFSNGWVVKTIAWLIWTIIAVANVYVLVTL